MTELVHPPVAEARYLHEVPKDGWGRKIMMRCPGFLDAKRPDVISAGHSGSFQVADNIW